MPVYTTSHKNLDYFSISAPKLQRDKKISILTLPFKLLKSTHQSKKILKKIKPSVIFSKGGFVSVPVCIAAKLLKIPVDSKNLSDSWIQKYRVHFKIKSKRGGQF